MGRARWRWATTLLLLRLGGGWGEILCIEFHVFLITSGPLIVLMMDLMVKYGCLWVGDMRGSLTLVAALFRYEHRCFGF